MTQGCNRCRLASVVCAHDDPPPLLPELLFGLLRILIHTVGVVLLLLMGAIFYAVMIHTLVRVDHP